MKLGDKFGLLSRTILVPVASTFFGGRDTTRRDAAGVLRTILHVGSPEVSRAEFDHAYQLATGRARRGIPGWIFVQVCFFGLLALLIGFGRSRPPILSLWLFGISAAAFVIMAIQHLRRPRIPLDTSTDRVVSAWLKIGRCPACAYRLAMTTEPNGLCRCTECGGVWKSPD